MLACIPAPNLKPDFLAKTNNIKTVIFSLTPSHRSFLFE